MYIVTDPRTGLQCTGVLILVIFYFAYLVFLYLVCLLACYANDGGWKKKQFMFFDSSSYIYPDVHYIPVNTDNFIIYTAVSIGKCMTTP